MAIDPTKTQADASAVAKLLTAMFGTGPDGIESGFGTSEFWLVLLALGFDVAEPYVPGLKTISPDTQLAFAGLLAAAYTAFRTWRKKTAPAVK